MSGTEWIYPEGIDCFELLDIGILVPVDNGRQTEQGTLSLRISDKGERISRGHGKNGEKGKRKRKLAVKKSIKMGPNPTMLSSSHVTSDSYPQKTKCFIARVGIFCYAL